MIKDKILKRLKSLIKNKRKDNFIGHFITSLNITNYKYSGEINNNNFKLWNISTLMGIGYPVIIGEIEEVENTTVIRIQAKLNIYAKIIYFSLSSLLFSFLLYENITVTENYYGDSLIAQIIISISIISLFFLFNRLAYSEVKKRKIKEVENIILKTLIEEEKKSIIFK